MAFSSILTDKEEIEFLNKCRASINCNNNIPSHALKQPLEFEEFEQILSTKSNFYGNNKRTNRIILGIHSPKIVSNHSFKEEITMKETIFSREIKEIKEPAQKRQKLNNDNRDDGDHKMNDKDNEKPKQPPKGCEDLYDSEGELVEELQDLDPKLVEQIGSDLITKVDEISFNDIAGLETEKQKIKEAVIWPLTEPEYYANNELLEPPKGLLLFGPPGTGKTMIAKAIANECNATFFSITPSTVCSKWIGESAKLVKTTFHIARYLGKIKNSGSIVFFDEIDSLLGKRQSDGSDKMATLKTQFLMEFQGVGTNKDDGHVLIIGATNFPEAIDEAARRRLEKLIYIPLPNKNGRKQLFRNLLKKAKSHILEEHDIEMLADQTNGYSGSDIASAAKEAAVGPLREAMAEKQKNKDNPAYKRPSLRPVRYEDFQKALNEKQPSVSKDQVKKYENWNSQFCV